VPLVGARARVEDDDAVIAIAVGDEELVGGGIEAHVGGATEICGISVTLARARLADLHEEAPVARELEDLGVLLAVAGEPDVPLGVHVDAVLVGRPVIARARPAPGLEEIPLGVELHHRRRGRAAGIARRIRRCPALVLGE
jgi:hypothetical protein